jgi:Mrp family chromosome partitioning ATPase
VSNTVQIVTAQAGAKPVIDAASIPAYADLSMPAAALALLGSGGIKMIAEPVAAVARLTGHSRVLIASCRHGDGASTVAGALALDLATRLGIDTLLVDADQAGGVATETRVSGNGRPARIIPGGVTHLWTARCAKASESAEMPDHRGQSDQDQMIEELRQNMQRYRAAVVDLGAMRLDARMLGLAGPDHPVLVIARYGCTRRDELEATLAILKLAKCRIGGVILNAYESRATERLRWIPGIGRDGR